MLTIKDLTVSKELDRTAMAGVAGGFSFFSPNNEYFNSAQLAETIAAGGSAVNNNSMINAGVNTAGNGSQIIAPVFQRSSQVNDNDVLQLALQAALKL